MKKGHPPTDLMNEGVLFFKQRNFRLFFFTLSEVEVTVACTSLLFSCFFFFLFCFLLFSEC